MSKTNQIILWIIAIIIIAGLIWLGYSEKEVVEEGGVIKVGAILPLTGQNATYGEEIRNAIELAKDEINEKGGIKGKNLKIIYEDDQATPKLGVDAIQKLINIDNVSVILGSWASSVVLATAPIAEENKVIVMASAISPEITNAGEYIFRIQPSATFYTKKSAELLREMGISKSAIIYVNNDFGLGLKNAFVEDFEKLDGEVVLIESYFQGDSDFKTQLAKIKDKNPEIIFIPGYQDTIEVIKQIKELGIESKILSGPPFESKSTIEKLGEIAEEVIYAYHFVAGSEKSLSYEKSYLDKWGIQTGGFAPLMYDATNIIAETLKKCGENTECIKEELYNIEYQGIVGNITFDEYGDSSIPIVIKTVKDGKFIPYQSQ